MVDNIKQQRLWELDKKFESNKEDLIKQCLAKVNAKCKEGKKAKTDAFWTSVTFEKKGFADFYACSHKGDDYFAKYNYRPNDIEA